jgi:hypothetical protein
MRPGDSFLGPVSGVRWRPLRLRPCLPLVFFPKRPQRRCLSVCSFRPNPVRAGRVSLGLCHVIFVGVEHSESSLKSTLFEL